MLLHMIRHYIIRNLEIRHYFKEVRYPIIGLEKLKKSHSKYELKTTRVDTI